MQILHPVVKYGSRRAAIAGCGVGDSVLKCTATKPGCGPVSIFLDGELVDFGGLLVANGCVVNHPGIAANEDH